jgi:type IV pilus assembly protein PilB
MPRKKLGEMLVEAGALSDSGLTLALHEQRRWGGTLGRALVELKLVSEAELVRVLAQQLSLPSVDLDRVEIPGTVLELVPADLAQQHGIVPFAQPMKFLDVAMADQRSPAWGVDLRFRPQSARVARGDRP